MRSKVRWIMGALLGLALWCQSAGQAAERERTPKQKLYGLVVGFNPSSDKQIPTLRYADDDAVQNSELLIALGAEVILLAGLDENTRAPALLAQAVAS